jgi:hypothetical protein
MLKILAPSHRTASYDGARNALGGVQKSRQPNESTGNP